MSQNSKIFTYQTQGLTYTVTVYERDGQIYADINVSEGAMDVNAIYLADDVMSGASAGLKGPLNMNGAGATYEGETVQWDQAIKLSDPGLGRLGTGKETYLTQGETLTVPLSVDSLDDVDFVGIRATSTTTPKGRSRASRATPYRPKTPRNPCTTRCSSTTAPTPKAIRKAASSSCRKSRPTTPSTFPRCPKAPSRPFRTTCGSSRIRAARSSG
ncbi:MAG: hypothetical protein ACK414_03400 [Gemmobacter sp.]